MPTRQTLERAMSTEPYGYIIKPFEKHDLLARVRMALLRHRAKKSLTAPVSKS